MAKFSVPLVAILAFFVDGSLCSDGAAHSEDRDNIVASSVLKRILSDPQPAGERESANEESPSNIAPEKFISAGFPTDIEQYPWVVYVDVNYLNWTMWTKTYKKACCGGSLISSRHIITAAHCLDFNIVNVTVYLGEYNTASYPTDCVGSRCVQNVAMRVDRFTKHKGWNRETMRNDIAIMRLREHAPNNNYIRPINLTTFDINVSRNEGTTLIIAGWGLTESGKVSTIKRHAQVQLVPHYHCGAFRLYQGMLCAFSNIGRDTCSGDSGGPIMVELEGNYLLVGIVSFGDGICGSELSVYTDIYPYMDWIQDHIKN